MINPRTGATIANNDPYAQFAAYQQRMGLGAPQGVALRPSPVTVPQQRQQGVPGYAAGLGQTGGNVLGIQGGTFSPEFPSGNTWGYGTGYQPNPIGGSPAYQSQARGIGGSTPFLSNIQQQLGQMFGQTPGLGFQQQHMPVQQVQQAPQIYPGNSTVSGGSMTPMTPWLRQQTQSSPYASQMQAAAAKMIPMGAR